MAAWRNALIFGLYMLLVNRGVPPPHGFGVILVTNGQFQSLPLGESLDKPQDGVCDLLVR